MYQELTELINALDHTVPLDKMSKRKLTEERSNIKVIMDWCRAYRKTILEEKHERYPKKK